MVQALVRHYSGASSFPAHSDHLAYATAVMDLTPVPWGYDGMKVEGDET